MNPHIHSHQSLALTRDCEALLIPTGVKITVKKDTLVMITQALGNAYTVYVNGNLVRIAGKDGDALGMSTLEEVNPNSHPGSVEDKIWEVLKTCYDPEIPVNIVDLGLIYDCMFEANKAEIKMTLTAPGCGMGPVLVAEISEKLKSINEIDDVAIDLVFDPPWDRNKMSDVAKLQLGIL